MALPTVAVWSLAVGIRTGLDGGGQWWAAVVAVPMAAYLWLLAANDLVSSFRNKRKRRTAPAERSGKPVEE